MYLWLRVDADQICDWLCPQMHSAAMETVAVAMVTGHVTCHVMRQLGHVTMSHDANFVVAWRLPLETRVMRRSIQPSIIRDTYTTTSSSYKARIQPSLRPVMHRGVMVYSSWGDYPPLLSLGGESPCQATQYMKVGSGRILNDGLVIFGHSQNCLFQAVSPIQPAKWP